MGNTDPLFLKGSPEMLTDCRLIIDDPFLNHFNWGKCYVRSMYFFDIKMRSTVLQLHNFSVSFVLNII